MVAVCTVCLLFNAIHACSGKDVVDDEVDKNKRRYCTVSSRSSVEYLSNFDVNKTTFLISTLVLSE